jgi:hypothetical protein
MPKREKPLLKKSFGGSEYPWNNQHMGVCSGYCELCGKTTEAGPESPYVTQDVFLGLQVVEQCCGRVFDQIYEESGEEMALRFLKEFGANPLDPRFAVARILMEDVFASIDKKLKELQKQTEENQKILHRLEKSKH